MNILQGEANERRVRNRNRLANEIYRAPQIFEQGGEWPGDWQGRALLALGCHYKMAPTASEREGIFAQAQAILDELPEHTNAGGYFGELLREDCVNEQLLSGNSWFLRGLCLWYEIAGEERILQRIETITHSLLLRLGPAYLRYPAGGREAGAVDGHLQEKSVDGWRLSSDVACAFILLDGVTAVYALTGNSTLSGVIRTMIQAFERIDYVEYGCQTHATLSAARGIFRFWKSTGERRYFTLAQNIFRTYCACGMTANYANFNWFGKPFWTEPCAIVDSLLLAVGLFRETGEYSYAQIANRIYRNAFRRAQRPNGGAGCDSCLYEGNKQLKVLMYEAYFCCTMRYAEGLLCVWENTVFEQGEKKIVLFLSDFDGAGVQMRVRSEARGMRVAVETQASEAEVYVPVHAECDRPLQKNGFVRLASGGSCEIVPRFASERIAGTSVRLCGDDLWLQGPDGTYAAIDSGLDMTEEEFGVYVCSL